MKSSFPRHLDAATKRHGRALIADFPGINDDEAGRRVLLCALEAWQRAAGCRECIDRDGPLVVDRWGQKKPHPLLAAERDARAQYLAALKHLNLDLLPVGPIGRPGGK